MHKWRKKIQLNKQLQKFQRYKIDKKYLSFVNQNKHHNVFAEKEMFSTICFKKTINFNF